MFKVLHVINGADLGGISSFILNYYSHMDHDIFHFDFVMYDKEVGHNGRLLKEMGSQFFSVPGKKHLFRYIRVLKEILKEGNYDAIHVHTNTSSYIPLWIAKKMGIKKRVAHAHSAVVNPNFSYKVKSAIGHKLIPMTATNMCACSKIAGNTVFGTSNYTIIPNGIDVKKFQYNESLRKVKRDELGLDDSAYLIGMIGRLSDEKNTEYALKIMGKMPDGVQLIIAGDGPLRRKLEAEKEENVTFLGQRIDANELYQAFDLFLLPSKFEGFPISALEAISAGLPIIVSDNITDEISFGERVTYLPIDDNSIDKWVNTAQKYLKECRRTDGHEVVSNKYDIESCVSLLVGIYQEEKSNEFER